MSESIKVTGNVIAWLTPYTDMHRFEEKVRSGDADAVIRSLHFSPHDMSTNGWSAVGEAEVTLTLSTQDERMAAAIRGLEQQLAHERAESMKRQNAILDQISKLQALEYTPEVQA